jgi:hypothetical protein
VRVVTGFESCRVSVKNLPLSATKAQVETLFSQPGFTRFNVTVLRTSGDGLKEAIVVFEDGHTAELAVAGLDENEFEDKNLKMEIIPKTFRTLGSMNREQNTLTINWPAPLIEILIIFESFRDSEMQIKALRGLDGSYFRGKKLQVTFDMKGWFWPVYITINGIPAADANEISIRKLVGPASNIPHLIRSTSYDLDKSLDQLRGYLRIYDGLLDLEPQFSTSEKGTVSAKARFATWAQAKRAQDMLNGTSRGIFSGPNFSTSISTEILITDRTLVFCCLKDLRRRQDDWKSLDLIKSWLGH